MSVVTLRQLRSFNQFPVLSLVPSQLIRAVVCDLRLALEIGVVINMNRWLAESQGGRPCET